MKLRHERKEDFLVIMTAYKHCNCIRGGKKGQELHSCPHSYLHINKHLLTVHFGKMTEL